MIVTLIIISIILAIAIWFGVIQYIARIKNQKIIEQTLLKVSKALRIMQDADRSGAFQSDDEVGGTFLLITTTIEQLYNYYVNRIGDKVK